MREKMGDNKKFKKERERRKGKNKKLPKEEMAWLSENTRFDKSNINAWHKVREGDKDKENLLFPKIDHLLKVMLNLESLV